PWSTWLTPYGVTSRSGARVSDPVRDHPVHGRLPWAIPWTEGGASSTRSAKAQRSAQRELDQPVDQAGIVQPGGRPHPGEHRVRREPRHRVDLVEQQGAVLAEEEVDPRQPFHRQGLEGSDG